MNYYTMTNDEQKKADEYKNMLNHRIIIKLKEALLIMENANQQDSEFYKELAGHPDKNDWLVEVDIKDKPDEKKFYIIKNCPENNKLLLQHQVVNLSPL